MVTLHCMGRLFSALIFIIAACWGMWQLYEEQTGSRRLGGDRHGAIAITGLFALAVYLEVFPRADYYHLVRVLPPVFLFFVALIVRCVPGLTELLKRRMPSPSRAALLVVCNSGRLAHRRRAKEQLGTAV